MTRILITGVTGMLGSKVFEIASELGMNAWGTSRRELDDMYPAEIFLRDHILLMEATREDAVRVLDTVKPAAVINCLGIVKQVTQDPEELMRVNHDFAHDLEQECRKRGIRMIDISTDCVFSGSRGNYAESDVPDPIDDYGRSKLAGETYDSPHLTIRTSIIGLERGTNRSLVSWFLSNPPGSSVKGHTHAIWSGLTTRALAPILLDLAVGQHRKVTGLLHIASSPISKYDLLQLCKRELRHDVNIVADDSVRIDRSLNHEKMDLLGIIVPPHEEMVAEMAKEYHP